MVKSVNTSAASGREAELQALLAEVMRRLDAGERIIDEELFVSHPHLMPQLRGELQVIRRIRKAYLSARKAGPMDSPVPLLSDEQLESPISLPEEPRFTAAPYRAQITGYSILGEIGAGGQATVFKAIQECTGRVVAIKVMFGGALAGSHHRARFDREISILARIDHPHIVNVIDRGCTADGSYFFVMNFVDGVALDEYRLEHAERSAELRLRLWIKIALAVDEAHRHGVVHRDLKPSNILVDKRGEPCVMDFGLARSLAAQTQTQTQMGQIIGSLPWTSPEQARGDLSVMDVRSDVYSLGVLFYQNLTEQFPYPVDGSIAVVLKNILTAEPTPPSCVVTDASRENQLAEMQRSGGRSAALDAVLLKALAKDPAERYPSAAAMAVDLEHVLAGGTPIVRPRVAARRFRLGPKQIALAAVVVLALALAASRWGHRSARPGIGSLAPVTNSWGMKFVSVPAQTFRMGSAPIEPGHESNEPLHAVRLSRTTCIGVTEVTQGQYEKIMGNNPADARFRGADLPVQRVSWYDAIEFCRRLGTMDGRHRYRLPTEAEWECACRGGNDPETSDEASLQKAGWFNANSGNKPHPVGTKAANAWGLYDMHGGVAEWCLDGYSANYGATLGAAAVDPTGDDHSPLKVVRGGDFTASADECRTSRRAFLEPRMALTTLGFRIVMEDTQSSAPQPVSASVRQSAQISPSVR